LYTGVQSGNRHQRGGTKTGSALPSGFQELSSVHRLVNLQASKDSQMIIEVCANGLESALRAEAAGAHRIELCSELSVGGLTPSAGCLQAVLEEVTLPVHVLIRPRSGPFTYNAVEWKQMEAELDSVLDSGAQGIVWGALTPGFEIDIQALERLLKRLEQADTRPHFTFHRAIDWVIDRNKSLKALTHYPIDAVLSSGAAVSAQQVLTTLVQDQLVLDQIDLMPGGGVHAHNVSLFKEAGFRAIHLSGTAFEDRGIEEQGRPSLAFNQSELVEEFRVRVSSEDRIRQVFEIVNSE
jgi:copper homeostasis protein